MKTVDVNYYHKFFIWHEERAADPIYRQLTAEQRGILASLELLAAKTNWDGYFSIRADRKGHLTQTELAEHLSFEITGLSEKRAGVILDDLIEKRLLKKTQGRKLKIEFWSRWQTTSGNPATIRQQKRRSILRKKEMVRAFNLLRKQQGNEFPRSYCLYLFSEFLDDVKDKNASNILCDLIDDGWIRESAKGTVIIDEGSAAAPPPPPSVSESDSGRDDVTQKRDTSHTETDIKKRDTDISRNSVSEDGPARVDTRAGTDPSSVGRGRGSGGLDHLLLNEDLYAIIRGLDPVEAACKITGDTQPIAINSWKKYIREWPDDEERSEEEFLRCLEDLVAELKPPTNPKAETNPAKYFNGILKKRLATRIKLLPKTE